MKIKSNRQWIVNTLLIPLIVITIFLVFVIVAFCLDAWGSREFPEAIYICGIVEMLYICAVLIVKFYRGKSYKFTCETIIVYKKGKEIEKISREDIKSIKFNVFKVRMFFTIFAGMLREGGCWQLHISMRDGMKKNLGYFTLKDVRKLKDELYGDLLIIS